MVRGWHHCLLRQKSANATNQDIAGGAGGIVCLTGVFFFFSFESNVKHIPAHHWIGSQFINIVVGHTYMHTHVHTHIELLQFHDILIDI